MANTKVSSEQIIDNVALAGNPTTTTQGASDNSTKLATTAYVTTAVSNLVDSAPSSLNTLNELAAAMNDNASFFSTVLPLSGGTMSGALNMGSQNITNVGTITASGGNSNNTDDANILTLNASEHARLLVDTSSTSGHRATLALESNSNELTLSTTGSNSFLTNPAGSFNLQIATDKVVSFAPNIGEIGSVTGFQAINTSGSANTDFGIRATTIRLATGSAERVRVTDAGLAVGSGFTPQRELHVRNSSSGATSTGNSVAVFEGNDNTEVSILGGSSSVMALNFGHSGDNNEGMITYNTTSGSQAMGLYVGGSEKVIIASSGYIVAQSASQVRLVLGSTGNSTNNTSNWVRGSGDEMDFNSAAGGYNWEVGGNKKMRLAASGKLGVGTTPIADPQHELVVHADSNPTIAIVGDGYNDDISIRFGGGDLTSALGNSNSGAAIHSTQSVSGGQAKGDLLFKINKGDSLQTAMTITNSQSVALHGSGTAGRSFEVQDKSDGYSTFWTGRSDAEGRGLTNANGLLGVTSLQYDGDGAYYPSAGLAAAYDNASGESVDFWFSSTQTEWQPMTFFAIGAHTNTGQTGQTAGWALIRATHYNNSLSVSVLDSGGGGTFSCSVVGSYGDDRSDTSKARITYSSNQNRTAISVWGCNYGVFYGASRS